MSSNSSRARGSGCTVPRAKPKGAWPIDRPVRFDEPEQPAEAEQYRDRSDEARFHVVLGSVRAAAEQQPTPRAARAVCKRYAAAIVQLGDQVAREKGAQR